MKREFIGVKDVAKWLGFSTHGVYKMVREENRIPHYKLDSTILFRISELEKWIESKKIES